jgi:hypothetical protein
MAVPNLLHIVQKAHRDFGPLTSHERCGEFTEYAVALLHAADPNFGHLKKDPGRTNYKGHAVDATLYKPTGHAVDIIGASKIASPQTPGTPVWGVEEEARYTEADWIAPSHLPSGDEEDDVNPPPPPKDEKPHVCPTIEPKYSYQETLSLANELDAAYRAEAHRTVHPEPLAHWIWRYHFEGYTRKSLIDDATKRGQQEA